MVKKRRRRNQKQVNIHDVGRHAGLSHITVSRVLNSSAHVKDETRARVWESVKALGYTPNLDARNLAGAGPVRIVFLYGEATQVYINLFLIGALQRARTEGCQVVVRFCNSPDAALEAVREISQGGADGILLPAPLCDSDAILKAISAADLPAVLVASAGPPSDFSTVSINNFEASREAVSHLLGIGHRRIGFIKGHPARAAAAERYRGYVEAMKDAGIAVAPQQVAQGYDTYRSALDAADYLLNNGFAPTAIFASNDDMAAATMDAAHRNGIRVPQDLSVVGFDDIAIATMIRPELTTVRRPITDMAFTAVGVLMHEIRNRISGTPPPASSTVLKHNLIVRDSIAALKAKRAGKPVRKAPVKRAKPAR